MYDDFEKACNDVLDNFIELIKYIESQKSIEIVIDGRVSPALLLQHKTNLKHASFTSNIYRCKKTLFYFYYRFKSSLESQFVSLTPCFYDFNRFKAVIDDKINESILKSFINYPYKIYSKNDITELDKHAQEYILKTRKMKFLKYISNVEINHDFFQKIPSRFTRVCVFNPAVYEPVIVGKSLYIESIKTVDQRIKKIIISDMENGDKRKSFEFHLNQFEDSMFDEFIEYFKPVCRSVDGRYIQVK